MARSGTARANSGSGRTRLIHASSTACGRYPYVAAVSVQPLPSCSLGNRILRVETGGRIQTQSMGERPEFGSQTGRGSLTFVKLRGFLPSAGLPGGAEGIRTSDLRSAGTRRAPLDPARPRPALLQKPGGGQSFGSSPLVAEAKFLPDPGEVVAAYRIVPPLLCGMVLQHLQPADHLLPTFPCLRRLARRLVA